MPRRVRYIRTDEHIDTLGSLAKAAESAKTALDSPLEWKWLLIAVHASLQGSFVLVLSRGGNLLPLKGEHAAAWLKAYSTGGPWPHKLDLDYFLELYAKSKLHVLSNSPSGAKFRVEKYHDSSMKLLNDLRNGFIHFSPQGWSIEAAGLPRLVLHCLDVLQFLLFESGAVVWPKASMPNRAHRDVKRLIARLGKIERRYAE